MLVDYNNITQLNSEISPGNKEEDFKKASLMSS
jgi:hypothetical protein